MEEQFREVRLKYFLSFHSGIKLFPEDALQFLHGFDRGGINPV